MGIREQYPDIKPSLNLDFANTKRLDPRITFTRTTTARYYDGKTVAKAEENLLLRSQEFNVSPWANARTNLTANAEVAPDGTTTAEALTEDSTASNTHQLTQLVAVGTTTATASIFVKNNSGTRLVAFHIDDGGSTNRVTVFVNPADGTIFSSAASNGTFSGASATVVTVGAWFRIVLTGTGNVQRVRINLSDSTGSQTYTGDGTSGIYIWGAQLEQRSSVTAYTPTTTQPVTNYIPVLQTAAAGVARFDHNPVTGESLGLLIEEQRSNLCLQSEDFATTWNIFQATVTTNQTVSPSGTISADQFEDTGSGSSVDQTITITANTTYTASVYLKRNNNDWYRISWVNAGFTNGVRTWVNLSTGTLGTTNILGSGAGATATITNVGNGWYRVSLSGVIDNSTTSGSFRINCASADNSSTRVLNAKVFIWGAQLEAGAFPTSYIKTEGSSVTRNADAASMTGANFSSWYRADEGTVYVEARNITNYANPDLFSISDGTNNNRISSSIGDTIHLLVRTNSVTQANLDGGTPVANAFNKICGAYKTNDFAASLNGGTVATDTEGVLPVVSSLTLGALNSSPSIGIVLRKFAYYGKRLSNAELQALTTV